MRQFAIKLFGLGELAARRAANHWRPSVLGEDDRVLSDVLKCEGAVIAGGQHFRRRLARLAVAIEPFAQPAFDLLQVGRNDLPTAQGFEIRTANLEEVHEPLPIFRLDVVRLQNGVELGVAFVGLPLVHECLGAPGPRDPDRAAARRPLAEPGKAVLCFFEIFDAFLRGGGVGRNDGVGQVVLIDRGGQFGLERFAIETLAGEGRKRLVLKAGLHLLGGLGEPR